MGVEEVVDYPKLLSEWDLFEEPLNQLQPKGEQTFAYQINSALFSDYAHKARFIQLPENTKINYVEAEVLDIPKGTILIKNFYYPADFRKPEGERRVLETRLLVHAAEGWDAMVYEWNDEQTDAKRLILGNRKTVEWTDKYGALQRVNYSIPSQPQCKSCHDMNGKLTPIGPTVRQLYREDQLISWTNNGWLQLPKEGTLPKLVNYLDQEADLDQRARAWLEINCAHCHRIEGPAKNSGLYLQASQTDPYRLGVNKPPIAAGKGSGGLKYRIVPGRRDDSILIHRIASMEPGEMMPEVGRGMNHKEGIALIEEWISAMD